MNLGHTFNLVCIQHRPVSWPGFSHAKEVTAYLYHTMIGGVGPDHQTGSRDTCFFCFEETQPEPEDAAVYHCPPIKATRLRQLQQTTTSVPFVTGA